MNHHPTYNIFSDPYESESQAKLLVGGGAWRTDRCWTSPGSSLRLWAPPASHRCQTRDRASSHDGWIGKAQLQNLLPLVEQNMWSLAVTEDLGRAVVEMCFAGSGHASRQRIEQLTIQR